MLPFSFSRNGATSGEGDDEERRAGYHQLRAGELPAVYGWFWYSPNLNA